MSQVLAYDQSAALRVEKLYRTPEIIEQRDHVLRLLAPRKGERIIDIGYGPGLLTCELAAEVAPNGTVCGVDVSEATLALATENQRHAQPDTRAKFECADANALPFPDGSFDAALATQTYEFVPRIDTALAELRRVLRPDGRVLILDTDWDTAVWHSNDDATTARLLTAWANRTAPPHLPLTLAARLRHAGFELVHRSTWTILDTDGRPSSYSRQQADHIVASLARTGPLLADTRAGLHS
jgi:arsenite methyltransferase